MSHVTTHVLDAALGRPAEQVAVRLEHRSEEGWDLVAEGVTDEDGRIGALGPDHLPEGVYRLVFDTDLYFGATGQVGFYPDVTVSFVLADTAAHYHVPLLLSPFAYSTYRGS